MAEDVETEDLDPGKAIGAFDDRWLICRDLGHSWRPGSFKRAASNTHYVRVLKCRNCKTERHDGVSLWGSVVYRRYEYPDGYQVKGMGSYAVSRDDFRREVMRRAGLADVEQRDDWTTKL